MKMFEQIGEFKPDSLIAGNEFPILTAGIGLKAGYGLLRRVTRPDMRREPFRR